MTVRFLALGMAMATLLLAGCSKQSSGAAASKNVDLGTVELSYGVPSRQDLGGKAACVLTAQPLNTGTIELVAALEKSGKQVTITRVSPAGVDQPVHVTLDVYQIDLRPHIK